MLAVLKLGLSALRLLPVRHRIGLALVVVFSIVIAALDGAAIVLISNVFAGYSDSISPSLTLEDNWTEILIAFSLFSVRSMVSIAVSWFSTTLFAAHEFYFANRNISDIQNMKLEERLSLSLSDTLFYVDRGPTALVSSLIVKICQLIVEFATGIVIIAAVFYSRPQVAATSVTFLLAIGLLQYLIFSHLSRSNGAALVDRLARTTNLLEDGNLLQETLGAMPSHTYLSELRHSRSQLATARARADFLRTAPRLFVEIALILGVAFVALSSAWLSGVNAVIPSLVLFGAAGLRLLPIVNQIQVIFLSMTIDFPIAQMGLSPRHKRGFGTFNTTTNVPTNICAGDAIPRVEFCDVTFRYSGAQRDTVSQISLTINAGSHHAIVGATGSGKSTILRLLLGTLSPVSGEVRYLCTSEVVVGFVPQDIPIFSGNIAQNIALEWNDSHIDFSRVNEVLSMTQMDVHLRNNLVGLDHSASGLSGGQKQIIGICRALYRRATLLVLDEPTSDLDSLSENQITSVMEGLRNTVTVVTVAHRLRTVKEADVISLVEDGRIVACGNYSHLVDTSPRFRLFIQSSDLV